MTTIEQKQKQTQTREGEGAVFEVFRREGLPASADAPASAGAPEERILLPADSTEGQIVVAENFFTTAEADRIFAALDAERGIMQPEVTGRGARRAVTKRRTVHVAKNPATQRYGYAGLKGKDRACLKFGGDTNFGRIAQEVLAAVEKHEKRSFDLAVCNCYDDGTVQIGHHSDDETDLEPGAPIVSLTFCKDTRQMIFKHKQKRVGDIKVDLPTGSMLRMESPLQSHFTHAIPVRRRVETRRFNFTFRILKKAPVQGAPGETLKALQWALSFDK